jgi:membrane protease YdiL (CAAX protease family)
VNWTRGESGRPEGASGRRAPAPLRPSALRLWLALAPAATVPFLAALLYFVVLSAHPVAKLLYTGAKVFTVAWPALAVTVVLGEKLHWRSGGWRRRLAAVPLGAVVGVLIAAAMAALLATPARAAFFAGADAIRLKAVQLGILAWYWPFALFLSLVNSLVEEYYWRWFLYGQLRRVFPGWRAHALAGAAFGAHHVVIATQFFPGALGLVLGASVGVGGVIMSLLYERQGTVAGAWACHLVVDLGIMAAGHALLF